MTEWAGLGEPFAKLDSNIHILDTIDNDKLMAVTENYVYLFDIEGNELAKKTISEVMWDD